MRSVTRRLAAELWPSQCPGCRKVLPATEPLAFCAECYGKLPWWNTSRILAPQLPAALNSFTAPCLYEEPLREAIIQFKFHRATPFAKPLGKLMLPHMPSTPMLIVPVPSHPSRTSQRHYNHAVLLARYLAKHSGFPLNITALKRLTKGLPQAAKTRASRLKLPSTAFEADANIFLDQTVLLIDDIYTTGATAKACALALKKAGAHEVHMLTLAYTAPH